MRNYKLGPDGRGIIPEEKCRKLTEQYAKNWADVEAGYLNGLCELFELEFYKPVIDVWTSAVGATFSDPLIVGFFSDDSQDFVESLLHELIHVLISDNNKYSFFSTPKIEEKFNDLTAELYGSERSKSEREHIIIHAGMKYMFLDLMNKPERLKRTLENTNKYSPSDYINSWQYVQGNDYKEIINEFKAHYKTLEA